MNVENLKKLRKIGQQLLDSRKDNFGWGVWDCRTFACWAGHYDRSEKIGIATVEGSVFRFLRDHFGINRQQASVLFDTLDGDSSRCSANRPGPQAYAELERRMEILDEMLPEQEPKHQGIPDSVLAIFDVEVTV